MTITFDAETREKLELAKAGIPEEDAFELLVVARQFPPTPFPKIEGVVIEPDRKIQEGLLGHLGYRGIQAFESAREEFCDPRKGETILLASAGEIEKIAAMPEVTKIELRDVGGHLIDEFNEGKRHLLSAINKEQATEPTRLPKLYGVLKGILAQPCRSFRPA